MRKAGDAVTARTPPQTATDTDRTPTMSFARFLTWLTALALTAGASLVVVRYAFSEPSWGNDAFGMLLGSVLFTREVYDKLIEMWTRP